MATTLPTPFQHQQPICQLDTYNYTVGTAGMHVVRTRLLESPPSGMTITIKLNSVTQTSLSAPASTQSVMNLLTTLNCSVNDIISVIYASSTASDQGPQAFNATLTIHQGSGN